MDSYGIHELERDRPRAETDKDVIISGLKAVNMQLALECDRLRSLVRAIKWQEPGCAMCNASVSGRREKL